MHVGHMKSHPYLLLPSLLIRRSRIINKNLNPIWDEAFSIAVEDVFKPVTVKVYDYDWGASDDFIGQTMIDLSQLDLNTLTELRFAIGFDLHSIGYMLGEKPSFFHRRNTVGRG